MIEVTHLITASPTKVTGRLTSFSAIPPAIGADTRTDLEARKANTFTVRLRTGTLDSWLENISYGSESGREKIGKGKMRSPT